MKYIKLYIIIMSLGLLTSCDEQNLIDYNIHNNTNDTIIVDISYIENSNTVIDLADTTTQLLPNKNLKLFTRIKWSPSVYNPENEDKIDYIIGAEVLRTIDSNKLKKNMTLTNNWIYTETGKNSADYDFDINDNDF